MTPLPPDRDILGRLEVTLYKQLLVMAVACGLVGAIFGGPDWAIAAALGPLAGIAYYALLAMSTRRVFASGRVPAPLFVILGLAGRQAVSLAAPALCFFWLGQPWLACLLTLVVARHWILVAAWPRGAALAPAPSST